MRMVGIDCGSYKAGVALLTKVRATPHLLAASRLIQSQKLPFEDRLAALHDQVAALLDEYAPTHVTVEDLFFNVNVPNLRSMTQIAKTIGVVSALVRRRNLPLRMLNVRTVRRTIGVGNRARSAEAKRQVRAEINRQFRDELVILGYDEGLKSTHEDVADAVAVAWAGVLWTSTER